MSANQPVLALIAEGAEYALLASEDSTTFVLRFKTDQLAAHLAGEDAARFQADYKTIKDQFPTWQPDRMLAQLWDQGGYSWLATQDG
ncbi:MAG: hypothetical protein WC807_18110 [Hyphomicrobium sp.]|jgi:hypothetical protein